MKLNFSNFSFPLRETGQLAQFVSVNLCNILKHAKEKVWDQK